MSDKIIDEVAKVIAESVGSIPWDDLPEHETPGAKEMLFSRPVADKEDARIIARKIQEIFK